MAPGATHFDLYFLPAAALPVLGWSEHALDGLLSGESALGRPIIERFVEHCADDVTLTSSVHDAEEAARARRIVVLSESTTATMLARSLKVTPIPASEFPNRRRYDAVRHVTRARWTLHHRVRLLAECASNEDAPTATTLCMRYTHAPNVDPAAVQAALQKGIHAVTKTLASSS